MPVREEGPYETWKQFPLWFTSLKKRRRSCPRIHGIAVKHFPQVDIAGIYIGTIHSWCLNYLLNQSEYYNVSIVDELHLDALVSRLYDTLEIEATYGGSYPKGIPRFLSDLEVFYNEHLQCHPSQNPCRLIPGIPLRKSLLPTRGHSPQEGRTYVLTRFLCSPAPAGCHAPTGPGPPPGRRQQYVTADSTFQWRLSSGTHTYLFGRGSRAGRPGRRTHGAYGLWSRRRAAQTPAGQTVGRVSAATCRLHTGATLALPRSLAAERTAGR